MRFSERFGYVDIRSAVQLEDLDDDARTDIWNLVYALILRPNRSNGRVIDKAFHPIWANLYREDVDEYPGSTYIGDIVKEWIKDEPWYRVYDLIEELDGRFPDFTPHINSVLEKAKAAYRVVDGKVAPISDTTELSEIEIAIGSDHEAVRYHLRQALEHLADRENPDYANSIKESVTAVESKAVVMTGKGTLGAALDELKKKGPYVHPALLEGWKKIYGWASDEDGLRHGGETAPDIDQDLARYMLVTCSAFVNLLTAAESE